MFELQEIPRRSERLAGVVSATEGKTKEKSRREREDRARSDFEKTYEENTGNSGTKTKEAGTSAEKASTKAEKAGSSLKKRKTKANEEKKKVNACTLDQYLRRIVLRIIN